MAHAVVHFEIGAADDGSLVAFYGGLFGWTLQASAGGGHTTIDTRGGAGSTAASAGARPAQAWSAFCVETDDPQATLDKANSLGGTTSCRSPTSRPLTMAMFQRPRRAAGRPGAGAGRAAPAGRPVRRGSGRGGRLVRGHGFGRRADAAVLRGAVRLDDRPPASRATGWWTPAAAGASRAASAAAWSPAGRGLRGSGRCGRNPAPGRGTRRIARSRRPRWSPLKNAARIALYGSADDVNIGMFRDPAGNVFGVYHKDVH